MKCYTLFLKICCVESPERLFLNFFKWYFLFPDSGIRGQVSKLLEWFIINVRTETICGEASVVTRLQSERLRLLDLTFFILSFMDDFVQFPITQPVLADIQAPPQVSSCLLDPSSPNSQTLLSDPVCSLINLWLLSRHYSEVQLSLKLWS